MARQVNVVNLVLLAIMVVAALTIQCAANAHGNVDAGSHGGAGTSRFLMAKTGGRGVARDGLNFCFGPGHSCKGLFFPPGATTACCPSFPKSKLYVCINVAKDSHNCGACGKLCNDDYFCCNGTCMSELNYDDNNCGECGKKCEYGAHCYKGMCGYNGHNHH